MQAFKAAAIAFCPERKKRRAGMIRHVFEHLDKAVLCYWFCSFISIFVKEL